MLTSLMGIVAPNAGVHMATAFLQNYSVHPPCLVPSKLWIQLFQKQLITVMVFLTRAAILYYCLPTRLREGNVFSRVCLSHVTIAHKALDLTIQGPHPRPWPWRLPWATPQPLHVQTCSPCIPICRQTGSWYPTEMSYYYRLHASLVTWPEGCASRGVYIQGTGVCIQRVCIQGGWADPPPCILRDMVNERAVCILLECILVLLLPFVDLKKKVARLNRHNVERGERHSNTWGVFPHWLFCIFCRVKENATHETLIVNFNT